MNISKLLNEFETVQLGFNPVHDEMQTYLDGYQYNFFYSPRPNMPQVTKVGVNFVQVFADKLWHHVSEFPKINVPSSPENKENAEICEKVILATHQKNNSDLLWADWTFDGTVMGACVARTVFNVEKRCVEISRHDPRRCYWQKANGTGEVTAFWTATPMTREAIQEKYGVLVTGSDGLIQYDETNEFKDFDSKDYYLVVTKDTATTSYEFAGKTMLRQPFKHLQGGIPIDVAMPYKIANFNNMPSFYLSKLKALSAEFNELWRRRANVVRKLGNPLVYGRGIYKQNEQEVKNQMALDGGFVSLKENGELSLLTIPETKMIDTALNDCYQRMKDVMGFPTATFGESVGANTSGDALGMYFTPTQKMVTHYNKSYKAFLQGINAKILRGYKMFGKIGEQFTLSGFMPHGSLRSIDDGTMKYNKGNGYQLTFTTDNIVDYVTVVTPSAVTPKDDIGYKRFILDAVTNKFLSHTTGYDEIGILSPEDEFKLLEQEQNNPMLNPQGAQAIKAFDPNAQLVDQGGSNPQIPTPQEIIGG